MRVTLGCCHGCRQVEPFQATDLGRLCPFDLEKKRWAEIQAETLDGKHKTEAVFVHNDPGCVALATEWFILEMLRKAGPDIKELNLKTRFPKPLEYIVFRLQPGSFVPKECDR